MKRGDILITHVEPSSQQLLTCQYQLEEPVRLDVGRSEVLSTGGTFVDGVEALYEKNFDFSLLRAMSVRSQWALHWSRSAWMLANIMGLI